MDETARCDSLVVGQETGGEDDQNTVPQHDLSFLECLYRSPNGAGRWGVDKAKPAPGYDTFRVDQGTRVCLLCCLLKTHTSHDSGPMLGERFLRGAHDQVMFKYLQRALAKMTFFLK